MKMKKINSKLFKKMAALILSIFVFILISAMYVYAIDYQALEPNAFKGVTAQPTNLSVYLGQVFNYGIALAVVLALIYIIWGGIIKMTTDSWQGNDEAKSKIINALYGLGMALISWLLLYTINPELVNWQNNTFLNPKLSVTDFTKPCTNCVDVSSIGCKYSTSCTLDINLANKLKPALAGKNARITQAYPPP